MNELVTMDAVSILEAEIFPGIPLWLIISALAISFVVLLFILLLAWVLHAEKEAKRRVHHQPSSHEVVVELQRELLRSMEATAKQNWLMIWLTIIFITVSVLGGAVVMNFFQNIGDFSATWLAQFLEFINSLLAQ